MTLREYLKSKCRGVRPALVVAVLAAALAPTAAWANFNGSFDVSAGQSGRAPQVAVDRDRDALFVWVGFDGSNNRIYARARAADGDLAAIRIISPAGQDSTSPQVAMDPRGNAVIVWQRFDGENSRVQARFRAAGGRLGAVRTLSDAGQDAFDPQVAMSARGDAVIVWERFDGEFNLVQGRARAANGGELSQVLDISAEGENAYDPQVAMDADSDTLVVWENFEGSEQRIKSRFGTATGTFSQIQNVSALGAGFGVANPQVAMNADGDALVVWEQLDEEEFNRIHARFRRASGAFRPVQMLSAAGEADDPQVAIDADSDALVVWSRFDGAEEIYRVQARARAANGALDQVRNISAEGEDAFDPQVAKDADGDAMIVWVRDSRSTKLVGEPRGDAASDLSPQGGFSGSAIQARGRTGDGRLDPIQTLSDGVFSDDPQVAMDRNGDALAVWETSDGKVGRIEAALRPNPCSFPRRDLPPRVKRECEAQDRDRRN